MHERLGSKDLYKESTKLYWYIGKGEKRHRVVFGMRDPGETNTLLPVLKKMQNQAVDLFVFADNFAESALNNHDHGFVKSNEFDPLLRISAIKSDLVVTGISEWGGIEEALTLNARMDNIPVIWIEDYPGNVFRHHNVRKHSYLVVPDYLCVFNDWAKQKELEHRPDFDPERIIITGIPHYDKFVSEDCEPVRRSVRSGLGIDADELLIVYMGIDTLFVSPESLRVIAEGLKEIGIQSFRIAIRRHPRDANSIDDYLNAVSSISEKVIDTDSYTTDEIGMSADLVVTPGSSEGIYAVHRGIFSLHIMIPEIFLQSSLGNVRIIYPNVCESGSSPIIKSYQEVNLVLRKLLFDVEYRKDINKRMEQHYVDGNATERVAKFIFSLLEKA